MMTPEEVKELLTSEPQVGEYYVVTKGRRPGVYLSW
jgi:viroplasmin and RNaseH domain-containing protein